MAHDRSTAGETARGTVRVVVTDVAPLVRAYTLLGLRILRHTRRQALVALPCGVVLMLCRRSSVPARTASWPSLAAVAYNR